MILDDDNWLLPDHDVEIIKKKQHAIALVIPVLNEGERIRTQLAEIQALNYPLDIIIADGGSTDGATDLSSLKSLGVTSKVTKSGAGAMSAQMRAAFAFALRQGYDQIINMDGNYKDKTTDISQFIAKLDEGFDCVLPSRFIKGGVHINTPLIRTFAIQFIHAPLLSIASGKRMTDTTNSFRGYSATFLLDKRVQPFRDVFQKYNLPFYLSYKAARLGYKVTEVPTTRTYPNDGSVPTKIRGIKAQLGILVELILVCIGYFNVK